MVGRVLISLFFVVKMVVMRVGWKDGEEEVLWAKEVPGNRNREVTTHQNKVFLQLPDNL